MLPTPSFLKQLFHVAMERVLAVELMMGDVEQETKYLIFYNECVSLCACGD